MFWWMAVALVAQGSELAVHPSSGSATLTIDRELELTVTGATHGAPELAVSVGNLGAVASFDGGYRVSYHLPRAGPPATALVLARAVGPQPAFAAAVVHLIGVAEIEVETTPGARVELRVGTQRFGPEVVPQSGIARFAVPAAGREVAYRYRVETPAGSVFEHAATLTSPRVPAVVVGPLPETPLDAGMTLVFGAAAVHATEQRLVPASAVECRALGGTPLRRRDGGAEVAVFELRAPALPDGRLVLECGSGSSGWVRRTLRLAPAPPAVLWMRAAEEHVAGSGPLLVTVGAHTASGEPTELGEPVLLEITAPTPWAHAEWILPDRAEIALEVPTQLHGAPALQLTARLPGRNLETAVTIPLRAAAPAALRFDAPPSVPADGEITPIAVRLTDTFGNSLPQQPEVVAEIGRVTPGGYVSPRLTTRAQEILEARWQTLTERHKITLAPAVPIDAAMSAGAMWVDGDRWAVCLHARAGVTKDRWHLGGGLLAARGLGLPDTDDDLDIDQTWSLLGALAQAEIGTLSRPWVRGGAGTGLTAVRTSVRVTRDGSVAAPERVDWRISQIVALSVTGGHDVGPWGFEAGVTAIASLFGPDLIAAVVTAGIRYSWW